MAGEHQGADLDEDEGAASYTYADAIMCFSLLSALASPSFRAVPESTNSAGKIALGGRKVQEKACKRSMGNMAREYRRTMQAHRAAEYYRSADEERRLICSVDNMGP